MGDEAGSNLEMRCSADEAWYDGTLSVSPESKDLVVVHFNDFDEDEDETFHRSELRNPAKLRCRARVRSVQLQDSQCRTVYEGQKICGCLDDGEDRKYYDAQVSSVTTQKHSVKDGGEECLCKFTLLWLDGPRKRKYDEVGCAEVCFLSTDAPEDDPMVKNLLKSLPGNGDPPRRKLIKSVAKSVAKTVPNIVPSPRPRTPSPSLELAPSKKQPSREPSPSTQPNPKGLELPRTRSLPIGSKKKRIMQAEGELTVHASDNDALNRVEIDARRVSTQKDSDQAMAGPGGESDAADRRLLNVGGTREGKRGSVQGEEKRLVKGKAKVVTSDREEALREDAVQDIPRLSFKERRKSNTAKMAPPEKGIRQDVITQSLAERVKLKKTAKMATPDPVVREEAIKQDMIIQSLGERVKLKIAQKIPASPVEVHKSSLQKLGKQVVRKQVMKRKLIQLEDPCPDPLSLKFDKGLKVAKPRTPVKAKDIAAEPETPLKPNDIAVESTNVEPEPKVQKRRAGRPRKRPLPEPAETVTESAMAKTVEISSDHNHSPKDHIVAPNAENHSSDHAKNITKKKRPRDDSPERSLHDTDDRSSQEDETLEPHLRKQATAKKKKLIIGDHDGVPPHDIDTISSKSTHTDDMAAHHHDHQSPFRPHLDEANEMSCHMENISIAERFRDIENKYSSFSTPQAAQELISLAADHQHPCHVFRVSDQRTTTSAEETGPVKRRRAGTRQLVVTDDELELEDMVPEKHGSDDSTLQDECSPVTTLVQISMSEAPRESSAAFDEEVHVVRKEESLTRLLLIENMEPDVTSFDAMQVLERNTQGVCAVHVLPVLEFQVCASGYALYRDSGSAVQALRWLTSSSRFVVSHSGRPWIVSQAREVYGPRLCGFAAHTAFKSDDAGMCGIISDQPHAHGLYVVTKRDHSKFYQAQQMSKTYEEHKKWRRELYERIVQHEKKG